MKNREKYAEELMNYKGDDFCDDFIEPKILKTFGLNCKIDCDLCRMFQMIWLNEEYTEPEVDWSKVAVDTPILVRDSETGNWLKRYFAKFADGEVYAWVGGKTSWNSEDEANEWKYAKLAEMEGAE